MKSKERIQRRIAVIKAMDDPLEAIRELADLTYEIGEEACVEREQIRELTSQNRKALMGNGSQENSIIYRLGETVKCQTEMMATLASIQKSLIGDIDHPDTESIVSRLRDVERVIGNINKVAWMVASVFLTQLALFVWAFFIH